MIPQNIYRPDSTVVNYRNLKFMVIDDINLTRQSLRMLIQTMGGSKVSFGTNYGDSIFHLKNASELPDIILCDYNLEDGRDGQQLFEELRKLNLINDETIFIMVTAERSYEQVISVVELAPDDYVLKPFTPDRLRLRLDRVVIKKEFFQPFFKKKRTNDFSGAINALDILMRSEEGSPYRFDIMRYRAETFLLSGQRDSAQKTYESILLAHPFPWAKVGLAKTLFQNTQNDEALSLLEEVTTSHPDYLAAFDLKAQVFLAKGDFGNSQKTLQHASSRNPKNWDRKKLLAETALLNGDLATARAVTADVLKNNPRSGEQNYRESVNLARLYLQEGRDAETVDVLFDLSIEIMSGLTEIEKWNHAALLAAASPGQYGSDFLRSRHKILSLTEPSIEFGLDVVRAGLAMEDLEVATRMAFTLLFNKATRKAFKGLLMIFTFFDKSSDLKTVQKSVADKIAKTNK